VNYDKKIMAQARKEQCVCCGYFAEYHHIKSLKSGGSNEPYNLIPVCRATHQLIHQKGLVYVAIMHYSIKDWLINNGWEKCKIRSKWVRYTNTDTPESFED